MARGIAALFSPVAVAFTASCQNQSLTGEPASWYNAVPTAGGSSFNAAARPWTTSTCCTAEYSNLLATVGPTGLYDWNYSTCAANGTVHTLSSQCNQFLLWEEAAFSCDPYFAAFADNTQPGQGLLNRLPVCQGFCDDWFAACRNDYTCVDDWQDDFDFIAGAYVCPLGYSCKTFAQRYGNGTNMCNVMWGNSFTASANASACYSMWWWAGANPNAWVAATPAPRNAASPAAVSAALLVALLATAAAAASRG